jgi:ATP-binding cassette subfamily B protein
MSKINSNFKLIIKYFAPYKIELIGVFIALCFTSSSVLFLGKGIEFLIDKGISSHNSNLLNKALVIILIIIALLATATFCRSFLINNIAEKVINAIRQDIYRHIIYITPSYFEASKTSDTISRLTADTTLLSSIIGSVASVSLRNFLMLIGGICLLLITSIKLTIYTVAILPLVLILIIMIGKKVRVFAKDAQGKLGLISAQVEETINGIKVVQSNTRQEYEIKNFNIKTTQALNSATKWIKLRGILAATAILLVSVSITFVLWLGGSDVIDGKMSAGELTSFIFYSVLVASSIGGLSEVIGDIQRANGAIERLFELLKLEPAIKNSENPVILGSINPIIEFKNLNFTYPTRVEQSALKDFNLVINPGETVAIVGPSGSGKSTIFQLLLRFYDPNSGVITLNNTNIKCLDLQNLRSFFALVPQEPVIFSASAFENIRYGKIDASFDDIKNAARAAQIFDFIENLPHGFETFLGEKGVRISGGERQRIAIARAIVRNPKILLLDEATSNLDTQNEKLVQKSLEKLMHDRTTIVIAHRLSTIINADKIIVLNKGIIEAIGTHDELLAQNSLYSHLSILQG